MHQAWRQDSVTGGGGGRTKFWGAREVYLCEFERGTRAWEIYPSLDQMKKVKTKESKGFSGRKWEFKRFLQPKTGDLQKKKRSSSQKSSFSPQNVRKYQWQTPIWASICTPAAPSLEISLGHSPRLGGHNFCLGGTSSHLGGHGPGMPPRGAGSDVH